MWLCIIARLVTTALGLVLNKARNSAADKLKDGDTTDEKLRDVIIEDLNDIKTKIDGLSRKDLRASYCFLKEGVVTLNLVLHEANDEQINIDETSGAQNDGNKTTAATTRNESESGVLNEAIALSTAIQKLNNTSNGRLFAARGRFKAAFEKATEAFCNEALSLPDRILAAKLRVASKILECLQDTKAATAVCMLFLEELHDLPAIGETFSTYFKGRFKSCVYKASRLENVKSVLSLNFGISKFIATFSGELPNVRNWPRIHLPTRGKTIHPLFLDIDVVKEIFGKVEFQPPENQVNLPDIDLWWWCCCINSKGQLLARCGNRINIFNRSGDMKTFCQLRQATANPEGNYQEIMALPIDRYDNVFVIIRFEDCTSNKYVCVLFVFDFSGNEQYERVLDLVEYRDPYMNCVVNNDGDIIIHPPRNDHLYVYDSNGNVKSRLSLDKNSGYYTGDFISLQCVTDQNDIVMCTSKNVLVYTKEWKLKRTIKVKNKVLGVTYNYAASKLEILVEKQSTFGTTTACCILSYPENDEVECLYLPVNELGPCPKFCSHPAGPAAFVYRYIGQFKVVFM